MKGTSSIIGIVSLVAVAVLYILHFTGTNEPVKEAVKDELAAEQSGASLKIGYVKADSIILNYDLAQDLHDEFTKKQEAYNSEYGTKRETFEREAAAFQEKLQRGGFLTEQRAIQERDRLVGKEQEIMQLDQELSTKLNEIQVANNEQILDSLLSYLEEYNQNKKYDYIFNGAEILIGKEANNLTAEVLKALNERYSGEQED
ncbi:periplasmic chaperone for outer membrane proteins Skp [Tangfeifania diversioriginum]|uniref:Periplasmic chaperone for outer membrane proteins Skp n=1 Tax=Tangfeifania diversioriginum TaxID=1168035 RepID=A0A1M6BWV2_9BACT|nr:OmpH family outer membrane protein [Tangfeifania diversioriginum]SHI53216.1 periplasmic chaperone for outer membrane proteins Skp [Tangfeifania diversioriginum]